LKKGEAAVIELFHHVADQMAELARQLAKQGEALQDLPLQRHLSGM